MNVCLSALLGVVGGTAEALHEGVALTRDLYKAGSGQTGIIEAIKITLSLKCMLRGGGVGCATYILPLSIFFIGEF